MQYPKPIPVKNLKNLRSRVARFFGVVPLAAGSSSDQLNLDLMIPPDDLGDFVSLPEKSLSSFLSFICNAVPSGEVYLFGGLLRDLALYGRRGFNSDVDLVIEGDWDGVVKHLEHLHAEKNKFGGFRLKVAGWPIDIWNARETWAIKNGYVAYKGIASLTETTVLNWDAILMNWRTGNFIYRKDYFEDLEAGLLDVVMEKNPNPLGMLVRVLRHFYLKDAKKITRKAIVYLANATKNYNYDLIKQSEIDSYGDSFISYRIFKVFESIDLSEGDNLQEKLNLASEAVKQELLFSWQ